MGRLEGIISLYLLAGLPGPVWADEVLPPGRFKADADLAQKWKSDCEEKRNARACYNWGVHQAQTLGNEGSSVPRYKVACSRGLRLACFNVAGILIKSPETRDEGIGYFELTCNMPHHHSDDDSDLEKRLAGEGCELWALTQKYRNLSYDDLFKKLSQSEALGGPGAAANASVWFVNQSVVTTRSYFYSDPTICTTDSGCPARTEKYLVWGDLVTVESDDVTNGFRHVTYRSRSHRTTAGWLKAEDLTPVPLDLSPDHDLI
jgi:hypothetical protein